MKILHYAFIAAPAFLAGQLSAQNAYADPATIDRAVEQFTNAPIGVTGGARAPVDRRLKLRACPSPYALSLYGVRGDSVQVECPGYQGWRVYVPLVAESVKTSGPAQKSEIAPRPRPIVSRGDKVSITVQGAGFSVTQSGEALEEGTQGAWIRVRPPGKADTISAQVTGPGRVSIPLN